MYSSLHQRLRFSLVPLLLFFLLRKTTKTTRKAYLVSVNASSARFVNSHKTLHSFGFDVVHVRPPFLGASPRAKAMSNKQGLLSALELIRRGKDRWGYIFEDDIYLHERSRETFSELLQTEARNEFFQYLGICPTSVHHREVRTCGRCTHAMGFTKSGATEILALAKDDSFLLCTNQTPLHEPYLDVIIEEWCRKKGGFAVFGPTDAGTRAHKTHYGIFLQDRQTFVSIIKP